jgi:hypothetical protein
MQKSVIRFLFFSCLCLPGTLAGQLHGKWVGRLPEQVHESSGLLWVGGRLVTINDSGNAPVLYELDTTSLQVVREVRVANAGNTDWEALASDEDYIYIGDFGNNLGRRKDLGILRIAIADYLNKEWVVAELISFAYEDQVEFTGKGNSDWDAEALVATPDSLWIFTKQWQRKGTVVYSLPKTPGSHRARKSASYDTGGLVTGAALHAGGGSWFLLGYSGELEPFVLQVPGTTPEAGFPSNTRKFLLTVGYLKEQRKAPSAPDSAVGPGDTPPAGEVPFPVGFAQVEGITVSPEGDLLISAEAFDRKIISLPPALYRVPARTLLHGPGAKPERP